jgi:hypothetical protein
MDMKPTIKQESDTEGKDINMEVSTEVKTEPEESKEGIIKTEPLEGGPTTTEGVEVKKEDEDSASGEKFTKTEPMDASSNNTTTTVAVPSATPKTSRKGRDEDMSGKPQCKDF